MYRRYLHFAQKHFCSGMDVPTEVACFRVELFFQESWENGVQSDMNAIKRAHQVLAKIPFKLNP